MPLSSTFVAVENVEGLAIPPGLWPSALLSAWSNIEPTPVAPEATVDTLFEFLGLCPLLMPELTPLS